ncbi:uncharacterized protein F4822DRAFT_175052 [Hypoxylon trugodes]|uniref:uncharacterized protein n=1 Tax=Hypoxylon trugodes TaxID=326681 RepID=UPI0021991E87|nr:uncharacterized protein F4822DRAFT_175052 [Hypoxylon trugodes]KAI1391131.1 hypothetical protein F4822DRAFT_175052 [Hypoxylon trugodes]
MDYFEPKLSFEATEPGDSLLQREVSAKRDKPWFSKLLRSLLVIVLVMYVIISSTIIAIMVRSKVPEPYSPASHIISHERQPLYFGEDAKYTGLPEDVDEAWDSLLEPINIRVTEEELRQARADLSEDIVRLPDGGYVSVLSNALRRNIFRDYYYSNITAEEAEYNIVHMTHCVDTIRRRLMCKADIAVYTAYWIGDQYAHPSKELRSKSDTVCVNWKAIEEWSRDRLLERNKYKVKPGPYEESFARK